MKYVIAIIYGVVYGLLFAFVAELSAHVFAITSIMIKLQEIQDY